MLSTILFSTFLIFTSAQDCDWGTFFESSNSLCAVSGTEVSCSRLKPGPDSVSLSCRETLKLTGYTSYHCKSGMIYPRVYSSDCVTAEEPPCIPPSGSAANNMQFVRDDLHQFEELSAGTEYHVTCKDGFMFKDGVDSDLVTGRCEYENRRATIKSSKECLPACEVKDNNKLSEQIENLDRITIVYPSNIKKVGEGKVVHAKAQCNNGYSPANETVELVCTTKGVTSANSGYYLQTCKSEDTCLRCNKNCQVPSIDDGDVLARSSEKKTLAPGSYTIKSGEKTAYVQCYGNMNLIGTRYISCSDGAVTSEIPSCSGSAVVCSPPVVNNGFSSPDSSQKTSTTFTVSCSPGYTLGDPQNNEVSCDINNSEAQYSKIPQCHMGCGVPEIKNGEVVDKPQLLSPDSAPYQTDETVQVRCDEKYILQGEGVGRCDVTGWANLPTCLSEDELSELGKVSNKNSASGFTFQIALLMTLTILWLW